MAGSGRPPAGSTRGGGASSAAGCSARRIESPTAASTRRVGAHLAAVLEPGDVVLLSGELGAGKTTLVQGLVAALGSDEEATSPTFTLCRTYDTDPPVAHVDCWRLEQRHEIADLALEEVLDDGGVVVAEWGEAAAPVIGGEALSVRLSTPFHGPRREVRLVELTDSSGRFAARLDRLAERIGSEPDEGNAAGCRDGLRLLPAGAAAGAD